jgi:hypothetical protein
MYYVPFHLLLSTFHSFVDFNTNIRAHQRAQCTACALPLRVFEYNILVSLTVDIALLPDQLMGTDVNTQSATFAFFTFDLDGRHLFEFLVPGPEFRVH